MYLLRMPKADENMAEGTVLRWLVEEGDRVENEENVVECLADKGTFDAWSEADGTVLRIFTPEKSVVPVGYVLAAVGAPGEEMPDVEAMNKALLSIMEEELTAELGERKKKSVIPLAFWYFSVAGGLTLLTYAIHRRDPVFIVGQASGLFIYARNLYLIFKERKEGQKSE